MLLCTVLSMCLVDVSATEKGASKKVFKEKSGIVSMEAEHATKMVGWTEKSGLKNSSGVCMVDNGLRDSGHLTFKIEFSKTGNYIIYALHAKSTEGYRSDQANDCFATFNGKELEILGGSSCHGEHAHVIGMGTHQKVLEWQSRPKTHCETDRVKKVYFTVEKPGEYEFKISSRSEGYLMDKLVFVHENSDFIPSGAGPEQTY